MGKLFVIPPEVTKFTSTYSGDFDDPRRCQRTSGFCNDGLIGYANSEDCVGDEILDLLRARHSFEDVSFGSFAERTPMNFHIDSTR